MENKKISTELGIVIIIIVAITAGVFVWQYQKDIRLDEIQFQPMKLSRKSTEQPQHKEKPKRRIEFGDGCYAMTNGHIDETRFRNDFNTDPANTTVRYENKDFGISFNIPFNKKWGNKDCKVLPYLEFSGPNANPIIEFGLPRAYVTSQFHFGIGEKMDLSSLQKLHQGGINNKNHSRILKIGNYDVVTHTSYGELSATVIEIPAKDYIYYFEEIAPKNLTQISMDFENVIKSVKITNPGKEKISIIGFNKWKTYTDKASDLSLKYPPELNIESPRDGIILGLYTISPEEAKIPDAIAMNRLLIYQKDKDINDAMIDLKQSDLDNCSQTSIKIDGNSFPQISCRGEFANELWIYTLFEKKGNTIIVSYPGDNQENVVIFDKILSTVRFK